MNEERLIATLQACYFGDKGAYYKILKEYKQLQTENQQLKGTLELYENGVIYSSEIDKLKSTLEEIRETAINYIDQVIMYKEPAKELDEELNTLIGILMNKESDVK